jgi:uncharacterized UBP type Zn finger protein
MDQIRDVKPSSTRGFEECLKMKSHWVHLRMCLVCGNVACCDSSPNKHATKHYHAGSKSLMGADRHPELVRHSCEDTFEQFRSGTRSAWISGYKFL